MSTNILRSNEKNKSVKAKKKLINSNIYKIMALIVGIILLSTITSVALTKDTKEATIATYNFPGGQESTDAFNRYGMAEFQNKYDTNSYYGYITEGRMLARKIYDSSAKGLNSLFCFDNTLEFPTPSGKSYVNRGELLNLSSINTKGGTKSFTNAQKSQMYWLADNMFLKEEKNDAMKKYSKDMIFEGAYRKVNQYNETEALKPVNFKTGMRRYYANVTDDDLAVIEQWIIWYIISGDDSFDGAGAKMLKGQGQTAQDPTQERKMARKEIYQYLRYKVNQNTSYSPQTGSIPKDHKFLVGPTGLDVLNIGYVLKGIEFVAPQNAVNNIDDIKVHYVTDDGRRKGPELSSLEYVITRNGRTQRGTLKDQINKGKFDFKLINAIPEGFSGVYFQVQYKDASRSVTIFTPKNSQDSSVYQPIVNIEREVTPGTAGYILKIKQKPKEYDLALRKYIESIDGRSPKVSRVPTIDATNLKNDLNTTAKNTTAEYKHPKNALAVSKGSSIIYAMRVYNEVTEDQVANKIEDRLPKGLKLKANSSINSQYGWKNAGNGIISTEYTKNKIIPGAQKNGSTIVLSAIQVKVELEVEDTAPVNTVLTNIASIVTQEPTPERDSTPGNMKDTPTPTYKGNTGNKDDLTDKNYHYKGKEDDDDFEKVIIREKVMPTKEFDLSLRKFITNISNDKGKNEDHKSSRTPKVDVNGLKNGSSTTAKYTHPKNVVSLEHGDRVEYTIRVYNEGEIDGYAEEVADDIPAGLIFLPEDSVNKEYKWRVENGRIVTNYLARNNGLNNTIKAFDRNRSTELDYKDIKVAFKVDEKYDESKGAIKNTAQITKDYNSKGVKDRDSTPNNGKPEEDDQDYDNVIPKRKTYFDLSLRKFITNISNSKGKNEDHQDRTPKVEVSELKNGTSTTAKYTHPKNVVLLERGDRVEYTIRVYNEGDIDGYAEEVADDIPEGLIFLPEDKVNKQYKWKVVNGRITTNYLARNNGLNNTLKAFDKNKSTTLDYKDLKVAFKVDENYDEKKGAIVNTAQITKDYNSEDKKDRDSTPNNNKSEEDDQDYDNVIPKRETYFDLSLRKFITKISNDKGKNEDHKATRTPKVDVSELKNGTSTTAKYTHPKNVVSLDHGDRVEYTIRVYNEGDIDGYAEEVADDIPDGLVFLPEDSVNKQYKWKVVNGRITTNYLARNNGLNNTLKAFDKNKSTTLDYKDLKVAFKVDEKYDESKGAIVNTAQITKDYNSEGIEDRDSTPNNNKDEEDDQDYDNVIPKRETYFDLSLRKFITKISNDKGKNEDHKSSRTPKVDVSGLKNGTSTTAKYTHPKNVVSLDHGDRVEYTIRVYNEGDIDGYAEEVADDIPEGLIFLPDDSVNKEYKWKVVNGRITTNYLARNNGLNNTLKAFDKNKSTTLDYKDLKVAFKVDEKYDESKGAIVNTAQITKDYNSEDKKDRDSTPNNNKSEEDDQDYDNVIPKRETYFDLSLRKFITNISNGSDKSEDHMKTREPVVDVTGLKNGTSTTAIYNHPKNVVSLDHGDRVEYTIRVYNEGDIDGYAEEVADDIPEGLIFLPEDSVNKEYKWKVVNGRITTDYLAKENGKDKMLKAFDKKKDETLSYKDLKVAFKVDEKYDESKGAIVNTAQITKDYNEENKKDRDSTPNNNKPKEDDQDYDNVIPKRKKYFDLSLRKFIVNVSNTKGKNEDHMKTREPKVDVTELKKGTKTTATYTHPKNSVQLLHGDRVEYTIRVYNEGNIDGYAEEVSDNIPNGLIFLPEDSVNKEYKWKVENGKVKTDYLARKNGKDKMLKAFDKDKSTTLDYKDLKIAFKVDEKYKEKKAIKNIAEITEDYNEEGKPDRDSIPGNNKPNEDDEDYDSVIPGEEKIFDLALRKIVSKIIITEGKKERVIETNHKYEDQPEAVAKAELDRKKYATTEVKWEYKIRVTNEGEIAGYAKEVSDYIPEGTYFNEKDNPDWYKKEDGTVATKKLANTLLKPGDSAEVTIYLRWKKAKDNMGVKNNWAEITEDYNEYGVPDIDSVPGNKKRGEDDIDDAPVALVISTGADSTYYIATLSVLSIVTAGVAGMKYYIL